MQSRDVIFVIGYMRSGSSALTRVLSLSGCALPDLVVGAHSWNPSGNWDPIEALKLNTEFMVKHGSVLGDPTMRFHEIAIEDEERERFVQRIGAFLNSCPGIAPLVIKDQSITDLMPYWVDGTKRAGYSPRVVVPIRSVAECIASVRKNAPALPAEVGQIAWLKYNLLAEQQTRSIPRVFIEYSSLLRDWQSEMKRVASMLEIELNIHGNARVDAFLQPALRHHCVTTQAVPAGSQVLDWCNQVYRSLAAAATEADLRRDVLDGIYRSFKEQERAFRISVDYFRDKCDLSRVQVGLDGLSTWRAGSDF